MVESLNATVRVFTIQKYLVNGAIEYHSPTGSKSTIEVTVEDVKDAKGNVIGQKEGDDYTNGWFIGKAIDVIWQPKILGVWQLGEEQQAKKYGQFPGDFKLQDVNGDFKINDLDRQYLGYRTPRFRWNIRNEFNIYKTSMHHL